MVGPLAVDGYDVLAPLDGTGRSWRAVCLADGERVVLRRWPGGAARLAEVRRQAALWGSLPGSGVVAVRDVVARGDDLVVITELATGGGLAALLVRRGRLTPGQIVTLVAPIARTLAAAHDRGLVHGRISASAIVIDEAGRPMLTDWLLAGDADPTADVDALCAMASQSLDPEALEPLHSLLQSTTDVRTLADELLSLVQAEPLLASPAPVADDVAARAGSGVARRGAVGVVAVVALAVATALGGGLLWGRSDAGARGATLPPRQPLPTTSTPSPSATHPAPDWFSLVRTLEVRRIRALVLGDERLLAASELRGSALWRHDERILSSLTAMHARLRGARVSVQSARVRSVHPARVVVRVVDSLSSYDVVDSRGTVLAHHPARRAHTVELVLVLVDGHWRLWAVA